jgi:hypothetical protein
MNLVLFQIVVDSGLLILIWMVQLVVYPGFRYYSEPDLKRWHEIYTGRITLIVLPLMLAQLILYAYQLYGAPGILSAGQFLLVAATWLITFLYAVPLHASIEKDTDTTLSRAKLVRINWSRTILWTIIFILSLYTYE